MNYYCEYCLHYSKSLSNFINHKKTKKHLKNLDNNNLNKTTSIPEVSREYPEGILQVSQTIAKSAIKNSENFEENFDCEFCKIKFTKKNNYYRHRKICQLKHEDKKEIEKEYKNKMDLMEKEIYKKLLEEKSVMLDNFMANANVLLNKANDNTKITAQTLQTVSSSALKYANEKFKDTPALLPLDDFNINNLNFDNEEDKKQLVELLIYNAKQKSLDKLLGNHIIKYYKKENPEEQSFHATDCSRLNYIVRELIENALIWSIDKNGIKICSSIVKPLIKKCIDTLMEHQKVLLNEMTYGNFNKQKEVELIIDIIMSIDSGILETDINKYIAPYFNLEKNKN